MRLGTAALAWLGACSLGGIEPLPLRGPTPTVVMLMPVSGTAEPQLARQLLVAADPALRARGYYVIPADVGMMLLAERGLADAPPTPAAALAAAVRSFGADAFLCVRVEQWHAVYAPTLRHLDYDVGYELWSADDASLLWQLRQRNRWSWEGEVVRFTDHEDALDAYLGLSRRQEPFSPYRDDLDAARALHRQAFLYLPAGPVR